MELDEAQLLDALALLQVPMGTLGWLAQKCISSPYGRYVTPGGRCQLPARVSWVLQELPSLVLPLLLLLRAPPGTPTPNLLLLSMFVLHYVQRSLIFPLLIRGGKPTPVYVFLLAFLYCTFNGYLQGRYLTRHAVYAEDWLTDPRFLGGSLLWLLGLMINLHSDHILRNLREPGETGYKIPRGGLFEYVSTANFFGEVLEWVGFALASWSLQGACFMTFTFLVLYPRAHRHHRPVHLYSGKTILFD
ncbi:3-oxo-5-alpha-steroid 4-dehydrogenase 1 isoform X3 [Erinaceus europaeus]|uniref:3-oxo-5alpha-steroid 4-dehydrogenase (NADP(+)) n=1 Tax=Erinaceus europaeus TaxID=9365 RepID=A0ABM3XEG6_ERIEU|nr:3-oxo-5-alpha-steroid 4-dehydrogenase 1 isoform X3 [Erinaceus europaeus]